MVQGMSDLFTSCHNTKLFEEYRTQQRAYL